MVLIIKKNKFLTLQLQTRFDEKCNFPKVNEQNLNEVIVDIDNSASTEFNNESANTQLRRKTSPKIRQSISDIIQEFLRSKLMIKSKIFSLNFYYRLALLKIKK